MTITAVSADGVGHQFPDGTPDAVIDKTMRAYAGQTDAKPTSAPGPVNPVIDAVRSIPGGLAKGVSSTLGLPGDLREMAVSGVRSAFGNGAADAANFIGNALPVVGGPTSGNIDSVLSAPTGGYYQPQTTAGRYAEHIASFAPAAVGGEASLPARALRVVAPAVAGQVTRDVTGNPYAEGLATLAAGGATGAREMLSSPSTVPTVDALKGAARDAYSAVDNSGALIDKGAVASMADDLKGKLANLGIDKTLHPSAIAALNRIEQAGSENQTLQGMEVLRRIAGAAAQSTQPADKMMARVIRDHLDDFVSNLGPADMVGGVTDPGAIDALGNARDLWARSAKGELIDSRIAKARNNSSLFTGSGYENALRNQFRNLSNNDRAMARFSPEEQDAIRRVAIGGPIGNAMRLIGKLAPTGIVSAALGGGAGFAAGGEMGAVGVPLVGELGRLAATGITSRNANYASELVRAGRNAKPATAMNYSDILEQLAGTGLPQTAAVANGQVQRSINTPNY